MSDAATCFAIYRFRPDVSDSQIADLLSRHRTALESSGLVTSTRPTVVRSTHTHPEHKDFIEIFEWTNAEAPAAAHSNAAVSQVWQEFSMLTTAPTVTLSQLTEASHPWPHFAPFGVTYANAQMSAKPARASKPAKRSKSAAKSKAKPVAKKTAPAPKRPAVRMKSKPVAKRAAPKTKKRAMSRR